MTDYDFAVIGAGIAGASVACELQAHGRVVLLEREPLPGHHTTGRSAAVLVQNYGNAVVRRLTQASREFFERPPDGFAPYPLVFDRPVLFIGREDQRERLAEERKAGEDLGESTSAATDNDLVALETILSQGNEDDKLLSVPLNGPHGNHQRWRKTRRF